MSNRLKPQTTFSGQAEHRAGQSADRRDQLQGHGFRFRAAGLDKNGEVADLVRHLVKQNGQRGDDADAVAGQVGRADRQAVGEVVCEISGQVQVAGHFDFIWIGKGNELAQ